MDSNIVLIVGLAASTAVTAVAQIWRERQSTNREIRQRKWDKEDRMEARLESAHVLEVWDAKSDARQSDVLDKIQENTDLSEKAFEVGNNTNAKILALHAKIERGLATKEDK